MIKDVVGMEQFEEVMKEEKVLVDVYSTTCGPCKMLGFVLADLAKEVEDVTIVKIDFDKNKEVVEKYGVSSYPTIIFFKNGEEVSRLKGLQQKPVLKQMIQA